MQTKSKEIWYFICYQILSFCNKKPKNVNIYKISLILLFASYIQNCIKSYQRTKKVSSHLQICAYFNPPVMGFESWQMLQVQRQRRSFKIRDGFLFVNLVNSVLQIEYMSAKYQENLYRVRYAGELPSHLLNYFSNIIHLYNYLAENPQKIINATQKRIDIVVSSAHHHAVVTLELQKIEKVDSSYIFMRKMIIFKQQIDQNKLIRQANAAKNKELNEQIDKLFDEAKQKYHFCSIKLEDYQNTLKEKEEELNKLQQSVKQKQVKLLEILQKKGQCYTIDD